eukprot:1648678-Prymnesium_polylepis.2
MPASSCRCAPAERHPHWRLATPQKDPQHCALRPACCCCGGGRAAASRCSPSCLTATACCSRTGRCIQ